MGPWKSHFELLVPHRSPTQLADLARTRGGRRTKVGLIVRVRDGRIRARYNELSRSSTAPLLKGHLTQEPAGTRIVGDIQWTTVLAAPFATLGVGITFMAIGVWAAGSGDPVVAACFVLGGIAFGALSVVGFRSEGSHRAHEEARLRDELLSTFAGHAHR